MSNPIVSVSSSRDLSKPLAVGTVITLGSSASDADGNLTDHWLELQQPDGQWSWEGWLKTPDWSAGLKGDGKLSSKSATYTFDRPGVWHFRASATDEPNPDTTDRWYVSQTLTITIEQASTPPVEPAKKETQVALTGGKTIDIATGSELTVDGQVLQKLDQKGKYEITIKAPAVVVDPPVEPPVDVPSGNKIYPMDFATVSKRLGPKAPPTAKRRTNKYPTTRNADPSIPWDGKVDQRVQQFEYGEQRSNWDDFWSTEINLLFSRKDGSIVPGNCQSYAGYAGMAATRPRFLQVPHSDVAAYGQGRGTVTCGFRQRGFLSNETIVGTDLGEIFSYGTQTSRGSADWKGYLSIPDFNITKITTTSENEIGIAIGFSPMTRKGKYALFAIRAKWLESHTMHFHGSPNEASFDHFKLLGVYELPWKLSSEDPGSVAAASNGSWIGPSQTGGKDLGQINFADEGTRWGLREHPDANWSGILATKGIFMIGSRLAGEVKVYDLSARMARFRKDYTEADNARFAATMAAENSDDDAKIAYPPTDQEAPELAPKEVASYGVPEVQAIYIAPKLERWSKDWWKAFAGGQDGYVTAIDVSPLLSRYDYQIVGPGGIVKREKLGANITSITPYVYLQDWLAYWKDPNTGKTGGPLPEAAEGYNSEFMITDRGNARVLDVASYRDTVLQSVREYTDVNLKDPIHAVRNGRTNMVIVIDADEEQPGIVQFVVGGVPVPVRKDDPNKQNFYYVTDEPGNDQLCQAQVKLITKDKDGKPLVPVYADDENVN